MRVLLGGIIGAAATTAAWLGLEIAFHTNLAWLACVVGLVTGLCMRLLAGPDASGSAVRGATAAVLTGAAMIAGHQIVAVLTQRASEETQPAVPTAIAKNEQEAPNTETPDKPKPTKPAKKPNAEPATRPTTPPEGQPEVKPEAKPPAKPATDPITTHKPSSKATEIPKPDAKAKQQPAASRLAADIKRGLGSWEMLWLGLATLIAYVVARGRDRSPLAASGQQPSPA